jgi:hypothetical protein
MILSKTKALLHGYHGDRWIASGAFGSLKRIAYHVGLESKVKELETELLQALKEKYYTAKTRINQQ